MKPIFTTLRSISILLVVSCSILNGQTKAKEKKDDPKVVWKVPSKEAKIDIKYIGHRSVHPIKKKLKVGNLTVVCANGNDSATDWGPYYDLYLIYDSLGEMPHWSAVFKLGTSSNRVKSAKLLNKDTLEIVVDLHSHVSGEMQNIQKSTGHREKKLTVDISPINKIMLPENRPKKEGLLDLSVEVTLSLK